MQNRKIIFLLTLAIVGTLLLSACGGNKEEPTPTVSVDAIETNAVATFAVGLTQTALANPTNTPTASMTSSPVPTFAIDTVTPGGTSVSTGPTASCLRLVYLKDVTVPDNTVMNPGETFTKTWLVQNTGTCPWQTGFTFGLVGGNAMSANALTLNKTVEPGSQLELSVPMVAPANGTGTISATWRMADTSGGYFGDALTVVIVMSGTSTTPTATSTTAATATATSTSTSTPTETVP